LDGVFEYSDVDNAGSYALEEKVDAETISDRRHRLMAIQKKISRENLRARYFKDNLARFEEAHFHGADRRAFKGQSSCLGARLEGMAPEIDGKLYLTDIELPGGEVAEAGRRHPR